MSLSEESKEEREYLRRRALRALRIYFAQKRWPRFAMSLILLCTGGAGFGASVLLLNAGMERMWMRYPIALLFAWAAFLGLVRAWAEVERRYFQTEQDIEALLKGRDPADTLTRLEERDWSVFDWLDVPSFDTDGEGCVAGLVLFVLGAILLAAGWAIIGVLMAAPVLIAEVFLDAVFVAALYKRMRGLELKWWLAGAVQQTVGPVFVTAIALLATGFVLQKVAPEAKSIGGVIKHYHAERVHGN